MSRSTLSGAIIALSAVAALVFAYVVVHELSYASSHPNSYGPAQVIAWGAGAGIILAVAVGLVGYALNRSLELGA